MNEPRRLLDDPAAAPFLAERLRGAAAPAPISAEARARVSARLFAARALRAPSRDSHWQLAWPLARRFAPLFALSLLVVARVTTLGAPGTRPAHISLRPEARAPLASAEAEPLGTRSVPAPSSAKAPASALARAVSSETPTAKASPRPAHIRPRRSALPTQSSVAVQSEPRVSAWLLEARAALPAHPERALALIQANRDPRAPVSPEVVELTLRALDALRAEPKSALRAEPKSAHTLSKP